jgi:hypothetical protein
MRRPHRIAIGSSAAVAAAVLLAVGSAAIGPAALAESIASDATPPPDAADKATQVHIHITNGTAETLALTGATDSGTWQDRASDIAPGGSAEVSNYSAGDAQINLTYVGALSGATYSFEAETPLVGKNSASGSTTNSAYRVGTTVGTGYDPTYAFTIDGTTTFGPTGATETYTVPAGVTRLQVTAAGGAGGVETETAAGPATGARITGTLPVAPGQVLTIGVGGNGDDTGSGPHGGWGPTLGADDYSGGDVLPGSTYITGGGGGATVIADPGGQPLVVAGGGGGQGDPEADAPGGRGGYDGSLTGENGGPDGTGGRAGANSTTQGQSVTTTSPGPSGAGGGGYRGGLGGTQGAYQGGGAGSSYDAGLTDATVATATAATGQVTIVPATS